MNQPVIEPDLAPPAETGHVIGAPAAVMNILPAVTRQPGDLKRDINAGILDDPQNLFLERGRYPFVGVQRQHPIALRHVQGPVFLRPETDPVGLMNLVGIFPADGHSGIGAARIQNDDFVNPLDRLQTRPDIGFFVFGDDDG